MALICGNRGGFHPSSQGRPKGFLLQNHWFRSSYLISATASELQAAVVNSLVAALSDSHTSLKKNKKLMSQDLLLFYTKKQNEVHL